ncbi:Bax inhibitor-1 family protein, partial [Vibrio barjaei]|uniref:Bax inhibitor-1 family protein n=1 Tax=Vibrio barjaei TaxID=1676683 RepID=UPI002283CF86
SWVFGLNPFVFFIGSLVCMIGGVVMFAKSDNPAISFVGYNLVVLPMGLLVTFAVHNVSPDIVLNTIQLTGLIVGLMMVLGSIFPSFFLSLGKMLFMMLLSFVLVEIGLMLFTDIDRGFMDYIAAGIFSAYIAYDWARANSIPRTLDNAIDSAASMYIDIINLFLRLLSIAQND